MILLENVNFRVVKDDLTQTTWGETNPPFVGRKEPEQSQINPSRKKPFKREFAKTMKGCSLKKKPGIVVRKDWTAWNEQHRRGASKTAWSASDSANNAKADNPSMMKLHSQAQQYHEQAAQGYAKESNEYKEHMGEAATHARRSNDFRDKSANTKGFPTGASQAVRRSGFNNSSF